VGLFRLQVFGFLSTAFFFFLLAGLQPYLSTVPTVYLILYGLTFFFQNFGGNGTTYIVPSIIYRTEQKATLHGISAASGKLGAILGAEVLVYLTGSFCPGETCGDDATDSQISNGLRVTFAVCGFISVLG
jgi:PHS family inorganic phosphate transporter-like MFS transporter